MSKKEWIQIGLGVVVFALVLTGVRMWRGEEPQTVAEPLCPGCNVIVIGIDTLRADHIRSLGYARDTTPALDALGKKGYFFSQAISPSSWTVPTFMSIWTGLFPSAHGVTNKFVTFTPEKKQLSNLQVLSPGTRMFAEVMRDQGYATGGFTGDAGVSAKFGYNAGFDAYTDEKAFGGMGNSETHALAWLDSLDGKKFFMFFHGYDLHGQFAPADKETLRYVDQNYSGPYTGSPQEEAALRERVLTPEGVTLSPEDATFWKALYDGKISDADARLQKFLDELARRDLLANTVIVVVSDHGEEFYEHKGFDHGHSLYDEQLRVPLLFVVPGQKGGAIIPAQVTTRDLAPTLLSVLGIMPDATFASQIAHGRDLSLYFNDTERPGYEVFSETDYRDFTHKRSVRTADGWKYILTLENGQEELYHITKDPGEQNNLILADTKKAEELRVAVRTHLKDTLGVDPDAPITTGCLPVYDGECQ